VDFARQKRKVKQVEQYASRSRANRASQVVMFRKYRTGELPDVQIKAKEIIVPLQALARKDDILARMFFSTFVKSLLQCIPDVRVAILQN
jgi:DNA-dependent protein kinase catalytic subunit